MSFPLLPSAVLRFLHPFHSSTQWHYLCFVKCGSSDVWAGTTLYRSIIFLRWINQHTEMVDMRLTKHQKNWKPRNPCMLPSSLLDAMDPSYGLCRRCRCWPSSSPCNQLSNSQNQSISDQNC